MSAADNLDQLRADAWRLARRTRRLSRHWQRQIEDLADRVPRQVASARRRLRRRAQGISQHLEELWPTAVGGPVTRVLTPIETSLEKARRGAIRLGRRAVDRWEASEDGRQKAAAAIQEARATLLTVLEGGKAKAMDFLADYPEWRESALALSRRIRRRGERIEGAMERKRPILGRGKVHPVAWWLGFGVAMAMTALWLRNRLITRSLRNVVPEPGIDVNRYPSAFGEMAYRVAGDGPPLVLIHGLGPGAAHHVFNGNMDELARHFRVYAVDLLGFGQSDKPNMTYTGDRMAQTVSDFLRDVVGCPATVVASGLSAAFAARAVSQRPELASNLVLVNPIGEVRRTLGRRLVAAVGSVPFFERSLYYGMTDKARMAGRLKSRYFKAPEHVDETMVEAFFANARQPGADRAIRDMIAGRMDLDLTCELANLQVPLSIIWGRHALQPTRDKTERIIEANPDARLCVFENSAMFPQTDERDGFNQFLIDRFARQPASAAR